MKGYIEWLNENKLLERALNVGAKSAMPKENQAVILAGGAGSGKGMVLNNILNIPNARVFDVDKLKNDIIKMRPKSMADAFLKQTGKDLKQINLGNPDDVALIHKFVSDNKYDKKVITQFFISNGDVWPDGTPKPEKNLHKPNVVFDVTLKDEKKMFELCSLLQFYGWEKKNIHLVWILNDFEIASMQNQERDRKVPQDILKQTHVGASDTMREIVTNFEKFSGLMDGEIWVVPNKRNVDNVFDFKGKNAKGKSIIALKFYTALKVKDAGRPLLDIDEVLSQTVRRDSRVLSDIIGKYIPQDAKNWH